MHNFCLLFPPLMQSTALVSHYQLLSAHRLIEPQSFVLICLYCPQLNVLCLRQLSGHLQSIEMVFEILTATMFLKDIAQRNCDLLSIEFSAITSLASKWLCLNNCSC